MEIFSSLFIIYRYLRNAQNICNILLKRILFKFPVWSYEMSIFHRILKTPFYYYTLRILILARLANSRGSVSADFVDFWQSRENLSPQSLPHSHIHKNISTQVFVKVVYKCGFIFETK